MRNLRVPESNGKSEKYSYLEPTSFKHPDISWYPVPKFYKDDVSQHKLFCIDIVLFSITEDSGFLQKRKRNSNKLPLGIKLIKLTLLPHSSEENTK